CSCYFFFFSSRRRHTRWPRDWSSDVCSSDLRRQLQSLGWAGGGRRCPPLAAAPERGSAEGRFGASLERAWHRRRAVLLRFRRAQDRKSTRLNSSHVAISYAVFCLKKKN